MRGVYGGRLEVVWSSCGLLGIQSVRSRYRRLIGDLAVSELTETQERSERNLCTRIKKLTLVVIIEEENSGNIAGVGGNGDIVVITAARATATKRLVLIHVEAQIR